MTALISFPVTSPVLGVGQFSRVLLVYSCQAPKALPRIQKTTQVCREEDVTARSGINGHFHRVFRAFAELGQAIRTRSLARFLRGYGPHSPQLPPVSPAKSTLILYYWNSS
jgi:hypothetical protein